MTSTFKFAGTAVLAIALSAASAVLSAAGSPQAPAVAKPELATQPVRVDITLTRYQGDKKTSVLPFSLYASAGTRLDNRVSMRMGIDVPIGTVTSNESRT